MTHVTNAAALLYAELLQSVATDNGSVAKILPRGQPRFPYSRLPQRFGSGTYPSIRTSVLLAPCTASGTLQEYRGMRRLATMGALSVLAAFGAFSPLPAHADIIQSVYDTLVPGPLSTSGDWAQQLGTGISGNLTQAVFQIRFNRSPYYGPNIYFGIDACDDANYVQCVRVLTTGTLALSLNPVGAVGVDTDTTVTYSIPGGYQLDPNKYYLIHTGISVNNGAGAMLPYGSANDTYASGTATVVGLGDLGFNLTGISYTGTTTPPGPPTGVVLDHAIGGSIVTAPNYVSGGIPDGIAIQHSLLNSLPAGDYYAVVFFEGLTGCPSSNYHINAFIPGAYSGYDVRPDGFAKAHSTSVGGCMQQFHIDPNKGDPWQWGALSNTGTSSAIADTNNIPAFAICYDAASCDIIAPTNPTLTPQVGSTGSNVLFLPGTLTSELIRKNANGTKTVLWGSQIFNSNLGGLALDASGNSQPNIYVGSIIGSIFNTVHVYDSFISYMDSIASSTATSTQPLINRWYAYPYDWRYDVTDIVANGVLREDDTRDYLDQDVSTLASSSATGKVTIIAHSNGGLLAKALMLRLEAEGRSNLVDKIVLVGTPQLGTPKAVGQMLHGDDLTNMLGIVTYSGTVRAVAATMPGMYGLLPSPAYFSHVTTPVAMFSTTDSTNPYGTEFGADGINSYQEMVDFLTDKLGIHSTLSTSDLKVPMKLSATILSKEATTHAKLDTWAPTASTTIISLSGWGQPTPVNYLYTTTNGQFHCDSGGVLGFTCGFDINYQHIASTTEDGDDTVVTPSSIQNSSNTLFFNAKDYLRDRHVNVVHQSLLSALPVENEISMLLGRSDILSSYIQTVKPTPGLNPLMYTISAHSPVNIVATDNLGNQTGFVSIPGTTEFYRMVEDIPGSYADSYDDEKYLYIPKGVSVSVQATGYGSGTTTLEVGPLNQDGSITTLQRFGGINTQTGTTATFTVNTSGVAMNPLVDKDGNGTVDFTASSTATTTPQTTFQLIVQLRLKINALPVSPIIKALLLLTLQEIEKRQIIIALAKPYIIALEKLIWSQTDAKIIQQRAQLIELLTRM